MEAFPSPKFHENVMVSSFGSKLLLPEKTTVMGALPEV